MPILWRYMLVHYLKIFFFCVLTFIALLLTTRFDEIARFITLGPESFYIFYFIFYQIPYILPIAIPVGTLIASISLIRTLCESCELTALRAAGMTFRQLFAPVLTAGFVLAMANFYIISELATNSHLAITQLKGEIRAVNPLLLLNNQHLMRTKGYSFHILGNSKLGQYADDIVFAAPAGKDNSLNLVIAKKLTAQAPYFRGEKVSFISSIGNATSGFDMFVIENMKKAAISIEDFTESVERKIWTLSNDHLKLSLLFARLHDQRKTLQDAAEGSIRKRASEEVNSSYAEIFKRISAALAAFTFTLMGLCFGVSIGREVPKKKSMAAAFLALLYLVCFFTAKTLDHRIIAVSLLYLLPHIVIIGTSLWTMRRITYGIE